MILKFKVSKFSEKNGQHLMAIFPHVKANGKIVSNTVCICDGEITSLPL